jgi:hypothetical protein
VIDILANVLVNPVLASINLTAFLPILLRMREEVYSIIRESSKGQSPSPDNENESAAPTGKMKVSDLVPMIAMSKGSASLFITVSAPT